MSNAGLSFAYQLLYLLDATGYYSLALHVLGIHVCRATGQELVDIKHITFSNLLNATHILVVRHNKMVS